MLDNLQKYKEIAEYLSEYELVNAIEQMEKALDKEKYVVSFMGQYSSGKSKLINNILNMDLLPVHTTETTAVTTFIQYGEESCGRLIFSDGSTKTIALEDVSNIWQGNTESEAQFDEIEYIEVFLNNAFLKCGLIIADTPGVNTIIEKHEQITSQLLLSTEEIIYVMAKTVSEYDLSMLKKIRDNGIKFSFVRTHMDKVKSTEESVEKAVEENIDKIKAFMEDEEVNTYHVSNEQGSKWNEGISELRKYITSELATDVKANLQACCESKLLQIQTTLSKRIEKKISELTKLYDSDQIEIKAQKEKLEQELKLAKELMKRSNQKLNKEIAELDQESMENLQCAKIARIADYKEQLRLIPYDQQYDVKIKGLSFKALEEANLLLLENYYLPYEKMIQTNNLEIQKQLEDFDSLLEITEIPLPESIAGVKEVSLEKDYSIQMLKESLDTLTRKISEREEKIIKQGENIDEIQLLDEDTMRALQQIEAELEELGDYGQKWVVSENQSIQPSELLKGVGKITDIVTLLIPGKAYASVAAKAGKTMAAIGKVVKTADSAKDVLYSLKGIKDVMKTTRASTKRTKQVINAVETVRNGAQMVGVLDLLTFEHWFEKAGKVFDSPIRMEVDTVYEASYHQAKSQLTERYNKAKYMEIEQKEKIGFFTNEIEKQQELATIEQRNAEKLKEELARREEEIHEKAKEIAFERLKEDYVSWYSVKINELEKLIVRTNEANIKALMENYKEMSTSGLLQELTRASQEHEKLMDFTIYGEKSQLQEEIERCKEYQILLGDVNGK